jgi:hypothetical protein
MEAEFRFAINKLVDDALGSCAEVCTHEVLPAITDDELPFVLLRIMHGQVKSFHSTAHKAT